MYRIRPCVLAPLGLLHLSRPSNVSALILFPPPRPGLRSEGRGLAVLQRQERSEAKGKSLAEGLREEREEASEPCLQMNGENVSQLAEAARAAAAATSERGAGGSLPPSLPPSLLRGTTSQPTNQPVTVSGGRRTREGESEGKRGGGERRLRRLDERAPGRGRERV